MLNPEEYLSFLREKRRFLAFGFLVAFSSSFGQTYFVGIFGPSIQNTFRLSNTEWPALYLVATLVSAAILPWTGRWIDRAPLPTYTAAVIVTLCLGCLSFGFVEHIATLCIAVCLLRQAGQGLMSHVALTSMSRYFHAERGRAIAVATLGFAAAEATLPILALLAIGDIGWRQTFMVSAAGLGFVVLPLALWLLKGHHVRHQSYLETVNQQGDNATSQRSWSRGEVLRDVRFYLLLPGIVAPAFVLTALFFHHLLLAESKGWSGAWITGNYGIYAVTSAMVGLGCGFLIDRLGATRLVPLMLLPLGGGLLTIVVGDLSWVVWPYFALLGTGVGISHTAVAAMWAELYGVSSIGAIRSLVTAILVLVSALAPLAMGGLMALGFSIEEACLFFVAYVLLAFALMLVALRGEKNQLA